MMTTRGASIGQEHTTQGPAQGRTAPNIRHIMDLVAISRFIMRAGGADNSHLAHMSEISPPRPVHICTVVEARPRGSGDCTADRADESATDDVGWIMHAEIDA